MAIRVCGAGLWLPIARPLLIFNYKMSRNALTNRHMPHVDALRALAVISVFIYHLAPTALPGGFTGVDIFFVISGFVVSASVIQKKPANFPEFFLLDSTRGGCSASCQRCWSCCLL